MSRQDSGRESGPSRLTVALCSAAPALALGLWLGSRMADEPPPRGPYAGMGERRHADGPPPWDRASSAPRWGGPEGGGMAARRAAAMGPAASGNGRERGPRGVGSEGYGAHILAAYQSGDADAAWEALEQINRCAALGERLRLIEQARSQPGSSAELIRQQLMQVQAEMRRCQTVTPELAALASELALRAMRGQIPGAGAAYARATAYQGTERTRAEMLAALKQEAAEGQSAALDVMSSVGSQLGVSAVDQRGYKLAREALYPDPATPSSAADPKLSPDDEGRARDAALRIISAARGGGR